MFGLMSRAEHERILAEGQERARQTIAKANAERDVLKDRMAHVATASIRREAEVVKENDILRAKLAKFTAPRKRDALGHFLKDAVDAAGDEAALRVLG